MACTYCNMLMHGLCIGATEEKCCCDGKGFESAAEILVSGMSERGTWQKNALAMSDPTSTGRKRAAVRITDSYLESGPTCAWSGLLFAGGGPKPIVGCLQNVATDRHHGPDKSVLNNDDALPNFGTNLHAICDWCHNRWHAVNDKYYLPDGWISKKQSGDPRPENGRPWLPNPRYNWTPHDPNTKASELIIKQHEAWWNLRTDQRESLGVDFHEYARGLAVSSPRESSGPESFRDEAENSSAGPQS